MFQGFTNETIDFLWNIRFNNEKTWFEAHKDEYKTVLERPMRDLAHAVYEGFVESSDRLGLELHISRIYRDARRLHGRGPYKDHLWFSLRRPSEEWTVNPTYWFEITPETWSYGLGYYQAKALTMMKFRARIDKDPRPLKKLDSALRGQSEFILEGSAYARPKRDPNEPLSHWYNKKNFSLIHEEKIGEDLFSPALPERLVRGFEFFLPYYEYFASLDADPDPRELN